MFKTILAMFNKKAMLETGVTSMGGFAPVAVVLLRDHTVDGVFKILKTLPSGIIISGILKMIFKKAINAFAQTMREKGEPYLMNTIALIWRDKDVSLDSLRGGINKMPDLCVKADVKKEAMLLVDKYHSAVEIENVTQ